ncbi:MAG TPA: DUF1338 family protein, partial [Myxococcota bacterium]
ASQFARAHAAPFHNDHIALRTLAAPGPGIAQFARVFERLGWSHGGDYSFPDVHLRAAYLRRDGFPRIFISELDAAALPADAREALTSFGIDFTMAPGDSMEALAAWFAAPRPPPSSTLDLVARASQYGAWLLAFGRRVNHFTAAVDDVEVWQHRLASAGVPMKSEIECAPGGDLRQTASHAALVDVELADGVVRKLPYAYFEIAERHHGFDGFLAPQTRQLFEMTATLDDPSIEIDEVAPPYHAERRFPRRDLVIAVRASWVGGAVELPVTTKNVSLGGAYLALTDAPEVGVAVRAVLQLDPLEAALEVSGLIMWRTDSGAGLQFAWSGPADPSRARLAAFLDRFSS